MSKQSQLRNQNKSTFDKQAYALRREQRLAKTASDLVPTSSPTSYADDVNEANRQAATKQRSIVAGKRGTFGNASITNTERMQRYIRRAAVERIAELTNAGKIPLLPGKKPDAKEV